MRLGAPVARLLSETLEREGYPETAGKVADAIAKVIELYGFEPRVLFAEVSALIDNEVGVAQA